MLVIILFLLALIFAWPTAGMSILAYIAFLFIRGVVKAKTEARKTPYHFDDTGGNTTYQKEEIVNPLLIIGESLTGMNSLPSWINDERTLDQFIFDLRVMAAKRGVPKKYVFEYMEDEVTGQSVLHYMSVLQREGDSPMLQKIAAMQVLKGDWDKLDSSQQSKYIDNPTSSFPQNYS